MRTIIFDRLGNDFDWLSDDLSQRFSDLSNIAIFNLATSKADRVGFKTLEDSRKVRVFASNGEVVDA